MVIFLLFIVIILMVIFEASRNAKLNELDKKVTHLEAYLKRLTFTQSQKENTGASQKESPEPEKIVPEKKEPDSRVPGIGNFTNPVEPVIDDSPVNTEPVTEEPEPELIETEKITVQEEKVPSQHYSSPGFRRIEQQAPAEEESWYSKFRKNNPDLEKFIGENILSKVAITILVIGIAFFVKFAIDKDWINEVARVGIGILCGGVILGFAHKLHNRFKAFSSVLVAGGIAIFYFTIGIGFHQYHLFNQTTAFVIMFLITAFSVFISVSYDRIELAALSIIGGFATPFMVSTGQGNYQVLFIYILILDAGMLVLAYLRKWNLINILAYCFTMLLYIVWLETKVIGDPRGPYQGALIFGAIFYVVFVLMNIINNIKEKRKFDAFELSILISNTFLFYGEGMHILHYYNENLQGLFSVCMAVFNLACAWLLYKKYKADEKLVYLMIGLTLTFITVSAPVQLHGNYITLFWALESVLLIWLAQRSGIVLYRFASILITALMLFSLFMDWQQVYYSYEASEALNILLNKGFITGLVSACSAGAVVLLLQKEIKTKGEETLQFYGLDFHAKNYSSFLRIVFIALLYFTGIFELVYQLKLSLDEKTAFLIILESYHLLFLIALNIGMSGFKNKYLHTTLAGLNAISLIVFVFGFALLPVFDLKENLIHTQMNYAGFIFHYINLAAAVFLAIRTARTIREQELDLPYHAGWTTAAISAVIVYICSVELILHVSLFGLKNVADETAATVINKLGELREAHLHVVKIGFPILWGVLAFIFLSIGMRRQNKVFRISGLVLIAINVLKLFTYDIQNASEAGKIIAFIILGVVLLIISFMYQKIKALLLDDLKKKDPEHTNDQM